MSAPREYTEDEVRQQFLEHVWELIGYWRKLPNKTEREKMEGLAFSILSTLDGSSASICGFIVAPSTNPEDMQYHIDNGENWYAQNHESDIKCDIGGCLHELYHNFDPRKRHQRSQHQEIER